MGTREHDEDDIFAKMQTKEVCCVMIIADAKDNTHLYEDVFKEYYNWGEKLRRGGLAASEFRTKLMPFIVTHTPDLKGFSPIKVAVVKIKISFVTYVNVQSQH